MVSQRALKVGVRRQPKMRKSLPDVVPVLRDRTIRTAVVQPCRGCATECEGPQGRMDMPCSRDPLWVDMVRHNHPRARCPIGWTLRVEWREEVA